MQMLHQETSALVTGENSSGPITAVSGWRESNNYQLSIWIAITRDGFPPIIKVGKLPSLFPRDLLPEFYKARAFFASYYFLRDQLERLEIGFGRSLDQRNYNRCSKNSLKKSERFRKPQRAVCDLRE